MGTWGWVLTWVISMKMVRMMCTLLALACQSAWSSIMTLLHGQNTPADYSEMIYQKMRISEMNNVDDLPHQNMIEFLQTDIDGSVGFFC
jgi:hypothetical protein